GDSRPRQPRRRGWCGSGAARRIGACDRAQSNGASKEPEDHAGDLRCIFGCSAVDHGHEILNPAIPIDGAISADALSLMLARCFAETRLTRGDNRGGKAPRPISVRLSKAW